MVRRYIPVLLRRLVRERSAERCEYCLIPERFTLAPHWVDHVVADKHGGHTEAENLALSCAFCNQHKGTDLTSIDPETGQITLLFNPRRDSWPDHFCLNGSRIEGRTAIGRVTARLLQLNHPDRLEERELLVKLGVFVPGSSPTKPEAEGGSPPATN